MCTHSSRGELREERKCKWMAMLFRLLLLFFFFFFFNDTATTEIYTLSLHDALPIYLVIILEYSVVLHQSKCRVNVQYLNVGFQPSIEVLYGTHALHIRGKVDRRDRKSTRLNSSHTVISYAVFCLKKKKTNTTHKNIHT